MVILIRYSEFQCIWYIMVALLEQQVELLPRLPNILLVRLQVLNIRCILEELGPIRQIQSPSGGSLIEVKTD